MKKRIYFGTSRRKGKKKRYFYIETHCTIHELQEYKEFTE